MSPSALAGAELKDHAMKMQKQGRTVRSSTGGRVRLLALAVSLAATAFTGYGSVIGYLDPSPLGAGGYSYKDASAIATMMSGYGMAW